VEDNNKNFGPPKKSPEFVDFSRAESTDKKKLSGLSPILCKLQCLPISTIFILVNFRLYPMTVSLFPLLKHKSQPKWKYYLSCHFLAVTSWLIAKEGYKKIDKKHRIDFWIGIGIGTWSTAILMTIIGHLSADYLNKDMLIGLAIVNPVYFFECSEFH
jgi:predicted branched-subunit amino acid permease